MLHGNFAVAGRLSFLASAIVGIVRICALIITKPIMADDNGLPTALMLADVLRAARTEISSQQPTIDNEHVLSLIHI